MNSDPSKHHRHSTRLRGYDYSQAGAYFVTICAQDRECFFGEIVDSEMHLNDIGRIAAECWDAIPSHHSNVELDEYIIMPNHIHGIIVIVDDAHERRGVQLNAPTTDAPTVVPTRNLDNRLSAISPYRNSLSVIIRTFKAAMTATAHQIDRRDFAWQRNYYEHIIRNEREWNAIAEYTRNNPLRWSLDLDNPTNCIPRLPAKTVDDYLRDAGTTS